MTGRASRRSGREYDRRPRSQSRGREYDEPRSPLEEGSRPHRRHARSHSEDRELPTDDEYFHHRGRKRDRNETSRIRPPNRSHSPQKYRDKSQQEVSEENERRPESHRYKRKRREPSRSRSRSLSSDSSASSSRSRRRSDRKRLKDKKRRDGERRSRRGRHSEKDVRRSVLTGKKIKLKVHKDAGDLERDSNREELLQFLNSSY